MENRPENNKNESKPRPRRLPPVAAFVTLVIGGFFFAFSMLESISGFMERPIRWDFAVGGLMEILVFSAPFLLATWLLWVKPKIGGIILIAIGFAMTVWMWGGWNRPNDITEWVIRLIFTAVPVLLGSFTLIREKKSRPTLINSSV